MREENSSWRIFIDHHRSVEDQSVHELIIEHAMGQVLLSLSLSFFLF